MQNNLNKSLGTDASSLHGDGGKPSVARASFKEEWAPVLLSDGVYQISSIGRMISCARCVFDKRKVWQSFESIILKPCLRRGYFSYTMSINGRQIRMSAHRIVATTFIPNPENKPFVNHKNGIRTDNRVENLEWCTASENTKHSYINGFQSKKGEKSSSCKLTEKQVLGIFNSIGNSMAISKKYPISARTGKKYKI